MSEGAVTPVVLTFNEEENVGRTLASLAAFPRVVVVDSGSTDQTEAIAQSFPNVAWFGNEWRGFQAQWSFALSQTSITTPFVLALDADMSVSTDLAREAEAVASCAENDGGIIGFEYRIRGVRLLGSLYPPQLRLLRLSKARAGQRGHAHVLEVDGRVVRLSACLIHDDRKPLESFMSAQLGYSAIEIASLFSGQAAPRGLRSRIRRSFPFTPLIVWMLAWLRSGGPLGGSAARRYALERLIYEAILRWRVEDRLLQGTDAAPGIQEPCPHGRSRQ